MDIKNIWFDIILNFKKNFTHIEYDNFKDYLNVNVKVLVSSDFYNYFIEKIKEYFKVDNPFTIMKSLGYDHSCIYFPEQGVLQLYELPEEVNSIVVEVYHNKKLINTFK